MTCPCYSNCVECGSPLGYSLTLRCLCSRECLAKWGVERELEGLIVHLDEGDNMATACWEGEYEAVTNLWLMPQGQLDFLARYYGCPHQPTKS